MYRPRHRLSPRSVFNSRCSVKAVLSKASLQPVLPRDVSPPWCPTLLTIRLCTQQTLRAALPHDMRSNDIPPVAMPTTPTGTLATMPPALPAALAPAYADPDSLQRQDEQVWLCRAYSVSCTRVRHANLTCTFRCDTAVSCASTSSSSNTYCSHCRLPAPPRISRYVTDGRRC